MYRNYLYNININVSLHVWTELREKAPPQRASGWAATWLVHSYMRMIWPKWLEIEGLQRALNMFDAEWTVAGMKISTHKTELLFLARRPDQSDIRLNGVTLRQVDKFKYLGVVFSCDGR